ncbi:hypothetical protein BU15DRAFT_75589 [Melanogaster broomeanus]|nr:hypothetical protein BU15DRAFT_75589 [Melanogaster broomeanus]
MSPHVGQSTTSTKSHDGIYHFSEPTPGQVGYLQAKNASPSSESLALTCITSASIPTPVLYFDSVASDTIASAQFAPRLRAYTTSNYEETQILRSQVSSSVIWDQNLAELDESSTWALSHNLMTGEYTLLRV